MFLDKKELQVLWLSTTKNILICRFFHFYHFSHNKQCLAFLVCNMKCLAFQEKKIMLSLMLLRLHGRPVVTWSFLLAVLNKWFFEDGERLETRADITSFFLLGLLGRFSLALAVAFPNAHFVVKELFGDELAAGFDNVIFCFLAFFFPILLICTAHIFLLKFSKVHAVFSFILCPFASILHDFFILNIHSILFTFVHVFSHFL